MSFYQKLKKKVSAALNLIFIKNNQQTNMKKLFYSLPFILFSANSFAVDARSYSMLPDDINLVEAQILSVSTEKKLPNSVKVENELKSTNLRYLRTFNVFDNLGAAYIQLPYSKNQGNLNLGPFNINQEDYGVGDVKLFFALGLYNMPALSRESFAKYDKDGTRGGCSVALNLPTGDYSESKLFNIGTNHYSLKNECMLSYTKNGFVAEFINGFTAYGENKKNFGGTRKSQKELYQSELHFTYNFTPKFWSGVDLFYQHGGEQSVNGVSSRDKVNNTLVGLVGNYTIDRGQYLKFNYIKTVKSPEFAAKSDFLWLTYQRLF